MPAFKNMASLQAALVKGLGKAVNTFTLDAMDEVNKSVDQFYGEFSPRYYDRTSLLATTPTMKEPSVGGMGASAEIYLDEGRGGYDTGAWDLATVLADANAGNHGGIPGGHPLWDYPMETIEGQEDGMWRKALSSAGLPIA